MLENSRITKNSTQKLNNLVIEIEAHLMNTDYVIDDYHSCTNICVPAVVLNNCKHASSHALSLRQS
jgi:hypothetical protein